jgi:hypothetical protein
MMEHITARYIAATLIMRESSAGCAMSTSEELELREVVEEIAHDLLI